MNDVTAAIVFTVVDAILFVGILLDVGPFKPVRAALESLWRALRALLHDVTHRRQPAKRKPYLSADTVEKLEIECYIGPYAEPFRAESLKAREAAKRKRDSVRVVEPCERGDETAHIFAMNGRCILCGGSR